MNTHNLPATEEYPLDLSPDSLQSRVLAFIRANDGATEDDLMRAFYPSPQFPAPTERTPETIEAWRTAQYDWQSRAYYRAGIVEYKDCYSSLLACATIALRKAGLIRTENNGFNCYSYFAR